MSLKSAFILFLLFVSYSSGARRSNGFDLLFESDDSPYSFTDYHPNSDENKGHTDLVLGTIMSWFRECAIQGGCEYGNCWRRCGVDAKHTYGHKCYTTADLSSNAGTKKCRRNSDCNLCWPCGIPCEVFRIS